MPAPQMCERRPEGQSLFLMMSRAGQVAVKVIGACQLSSSSLGRLKDADIYQKFTLFSPSSEMTSSNLNFADMQHLHNNNASWQQSSLCLDQSLEITCILTVP